jgi:hypothetical protein
MSKSIELFNEVLEMKESYSKNKSSFLQSIKKDFRDSGTNIQPKSVYFEVGDMNETFTKICENQDKAIQLLSEVFGLEKDFFDIRCQVVRSFVDTILRVHPMIRIQFGNSYVSICPFGDNGIEISSIVVNGEKGNGMGSVMMIHILALISDPFFCIDCEKVMLECVGSIGFGDNALQSSISQQTKFFRKFGFRVSKDRKDKYGNLNYVQMMYDEDKFDASIVMNELKNKASK